MMKSLFAVAVAATLLVAGSATAADTIDYNTTPTELWHFGGGNDYSPANTALLTTDLGEELGLRFHETFVVAPASVGNEYSFALGTPFVSFDWLIDSNGGSFSGITALLTLTNVGSGATFSYDPFGLGNDNELLNSSVQNSARLNWFPIDFDSNVDSTYNVKLEVFGLAGGTRSLDINAKLGDGATVPEPSTWALMIVGFGSAGALLRRQRHALAEA